MGDYRIISSDNHVIEPPDLWTSRMGSRFGDKCPHLVDGDGDQIWLFDGMKSSAVSGGTQAGRRFEDPSKLQPIEHIFENVPLGAYIGEEAVKDMDIDGVDVGIIYPTAGLSLFRAIRDSELLDACMGAYNDFLFQYCQADPKRLKGVAMVNLDDVGSAVRSLEHWAKMGFAGAMISSFPARMRYDSPEYEPLWAAAQDLGMPLSLHVLTSRPGPDAPFGDEYVDMMKVSSLINLDHWVRVSICDMILSGVFERYPKLMVGAIEHELSWVPHFLDRLNYRYLESIDGRGGYKLKGDMLPGDYFQRNIFLSFQADAVGIRLRDIIGVDMLQWGADYPHREGTFPRSREILGRVLEDCSEEEKAKIVGGNASRVYGV